MTTNIIYRMSESPFPPSFQGSGLSYGFALFSLMMIAIVGFYVVSVASRNIWANRKAETWEHVLALLAAIGASGRCIMDALYKMAWGEVSAPTLSYLLTSKNIVDAMIVIPFIGWMTIYILRVSDLDHNRGKSFRLAVSAVIVAIVAAIFAYSKV